MGVQHEYLIANCWIVVIVVWCIVIQVPQHNKFWSLDGGENGAAVRFHYLKMGQSSPPHSTYRHDLKIYSSDEGRVQVHAGSILTTLFAVSCSASIEDAASLDYMPLYILVIKELFWCALTVMWTLLFMQQVHSNTDSKLLEAAIESKTAYVDIADHEGFARCPKSYKNKAIAAGVPAITNAEANPGVSSLMAATLIHNAQRESKGQPERLRYHYFTAGSGGIVPGVLATSFYLIADEHNKFLACFCQWKVHAGSILTTLFAVSCSASMEHAASLDYGIMWTLFMQQVHSNTQTANCRKLQLSPSAYVDIADHEGFARCPKSYKNKAIAAGVPAITNAEANPGVSRNYITF
ncbi:hypothetical protein OROGR_025319 [Orobanche gracilis]